MIEKILIEFYYENNKIKADEYSQMVLSHKDIVVVGSISYIVENLISLSCSYFIATLKKLDDFSQLEKFVDSLSNEEIENLKKYLNNLNTKEIIDFKSLCDELFMAYQYGTDDKSKYHEFLNKDYVFFYKKYVDDGCIVHDYISYIGKLFMSSKEGKTVYEVLNFDRKLIDLNRSEMLKIPKLQVIKFNLEDFLRGNINV